MINMKFLLRLNGHEFIHPNALGIWVGYDHENDCPTIEPISTMNLAEYLSQYPAVRFIDSRPAVIEVISDGT